MLFEKLSENEKYMMDKYIDCYAYFDGAERTASLDYLLRVWDENKFEYLYRLLNEQFMYHKDIVIVKEESQIMDDIDRNLKSYNSKGRPFVDAYYAMANKFYIYKEEWSPEYTEEERDSNALFSALFELMDSRTLAKNVYDGNTFMLPTNDPEKPLKIQNGCKISKILGKIATAYSLPYFEEFRIAHSMCLNEKKLAGKLTISIHPFDYMTMSDNNSWTSCMSWTEGGEYRRGTVEMMNSPMVVCAYLESEEAFEPCYGIKWNAKKWRELFIVTPSIIAGIKGYPYWNRDIEAQIIMTLRQLAQENLGWGPYNSEPMTMYDNRLRCDEFDKDYYAYFETDAMYCDFYNKHQMIVSHNAPTHIYVNYSGPSECMACGSIQVDFNCESDLVCYNCDHGYYCDECGERYYREDLYEVDGSLVCEYCYNNLPECDYCGGVHYNENMYTIHLANDTEILSSSICICKDCYMSSYNELFDYHDVKSVYMDWRFYRYIHINDCTEEMLNKMGFDSAEEALNYKDRHAISLNRSA